MTIAAETTTTGQGVDDSHAHPVRRRGTKRAMPITTPIFPMPASENGSGDQVVVVAHTCSVATTVLQIRELQSQRVATMRAQFRIDNACRALARRALGWRMDLPEKERKRINDEAAGLVEAIRCGHASEAKQTVIADAIRPFVIASQTARQPFDAYRKQLESELRKLALSLPVMKWADSIHGFGELGLSIIVGEAGDLSNYSNPGKLWKRLGLAVINGKSQRRVIGDGAMEQGYNPRRRSAMWTIGDSLLKKENAYRTLYLERKAYEIARAPEMTKMHAHRRAQRYAEKRLVRDLWRAWRGAVASENTNPPPPYNPGPGHVLPDTHTKDAETDGPFLTLDACRAMLAAGRTRVRVPRENRQATIYRIDGHGVWGSYVTWRCERGIGVEDEHCGVWRAGELVDDNG
jgi:hypothetical protein